MKALLRGLIFYLVICLVTRWFECSTGFGYPNADRIILAVAIWLTDFIIRWRTN